MDDLKEIKEAIKKSQEEAIYQYRHGNIKDGEKAEKNYKDLRKILKAIEEG